MPSEKADATPQPQAVRAESHVASAGLARRTRLLDMGRCGDNSGKGGDGNVRR